MSLYAHKPSLSLLLSPPPSLNKSLRMHWAKRRRIAKDYEVEVLAVAIREARSQPWCKWEACRRRVVCTHIGRRLDPDSASGCLKPVLDALVHVGILVDDSLAWVDLHTRSVPGKPMALLVEVWK